MERRRSKNKLCSLSFLLDLQNDLSLLIFVLFELFPSCIFSQSVRILPRGKMWFLVLACVPSLFFQTREDVPTRITVTSNQVYFPFCRQQLSTLMKFYRILNEISRFRLHKGSVAKRWKIFQNPISTLNLGISLKIQLAVWRLEGFWLIVLDFLSFFYCKIQHTHSRAFLKCALSLATVPGLTMEPDVIVSQSVQEVLQRKQLFLGTLHCCEPNGYFFFFFFCYVLKLRAN